MKEFAPFGSKFFPLREVHENEGPKIVLEHSSKDNIVEQGLLENFFNCYYAWRKTNKRETKENVPPGRATLLPFLLVHVRHRYGR